MINCRYCEEQKSEHIESNNIINTLSDMNESNRAVLIRFIIQVKSKYHHTTIAEKDIQDTYCYSCGSIKERDDDGDRYYYMCTNMDCKSWNMGDEI